jgi:hypothetical protein
MQTSTTIVYVGIREGELNLKRVNFFTDGCADQYTSRRNAYFVGALAEGTMVITHNYAPTASFKTMVDAHGARQLMTFSSCSPPSIR